MKCGIETNLPFICSYCGGYFCTEHRLPESHDCPGMASAKPPRVDSGFKVSYTTSSPSYSFKKFGEEEIKQLLIAWIVIGFCFSARFLFSLETFPFCCLNSLFYRLHLI